jgi:hypothetical protein
MVSFVIFKKQPKLQDIYSNLRNQNFNPKFQEIDEVEVIAFVNYGGCLDVTISFDRDFSKISCLVINTANQKQFAYYESFYHQAVTGKDLLSWWLSTCIDLNGRVYAARAIELAFA